MPTDAEQLLGKLRKLSANRECVNCGEHSRLGFGAVCVKFQTFVCNNCKSSHQSFSHRVKSVTMSTWTMEEVEALRKRNGGGNEVAKAKWFARWTDSDEQRFKPRSGDKLDKYKQLVAMVYEDERWYDANATVGSSKSSTPKSSTSKAKGRKARSPKPSSESLFDTGSKNTSSSEPVEDLFGSLTIGGTNNATKAANTSSTENVDLLAGFSPTNPTPPPQQVDMMGDLLSLGSPSPPSQQQPLMGAGAPTAMPNLGMNGMVDDPFAALQQPKPPKMSTQQNQRMMKQQQQYMLQQQQMMQQQRQQMMQQQAMNSSDPFATLHMKPPQMMPRPMGMMGRGPPPQSQPQSNPMMMQPPQQQVPPRGMMPMAARPPSQMMMPPSQSSYNPDDPFAGL